jgi:hypothetical protein
VVVALEQRAVVGVPEAPTSDLARLSRECSANLRFVKKKREIYIFYKYTRTHAQDEESR